MILFSFICHISEKSVVGCRDWFGVILNLFPHLELLMYAKHISLLVDSNTVYGIIFYQMYLLPCPPPFFFCGILVMLYLAAGPTQHLYQGIKKYVVIGLLNIYWSTPSDKITPNCVSIILWSIAFMLSIKEEIIPNLPFQFQGCRWIY